MLVIFRLEQTLPKAFELLLNAPVLKEVDNSDVVKLLVSLSHCLPEPPREIRRGFVTHNDASVFLVHSRSIQH